MPTGQPKRNADDPIHISHSDDEAPCYDGCVQENRVTVGCAGVGGEKCGSFFGSPRCTRDAASILASFAPAVLSAPTTTIYCVTGFYHFVSSQKTKQRRGIRKKDDSVHGHVAPKQPCCAMASSSLDLVVVAPFVSKDLGYRSSPAVDALDHIVLHLGPHVSIRSL